MKCLRNIVIIASCRNSRIQELCLSEYFFQDTTMHEAEFLPGGFENNALLP